MQWVLWNYVHYFQGVLKDASTCGMDTIKHLYIDYKYIKPFTTFILKNVIVITIE